MSNTIGGHFTKNGIKQLPARAVLSLNGVGLGGDETHADTIAVMRDTLVFPDGEAPPDWRTYDGSNWTEYGRFWYQDAFLLDRNLKTQWALNPADYYQITNEQGGGEGPDVEGNYIQLVKVERAIMQAANADGRKCCVLNLAGGSPGDFELWKQICAPFIVEAWENGGNIYGRHCYADKFVNDDGSIVPGQPQRVIDELEYLRSIGYGGGMVLTECGLFGGYGVADYSYFEQQVTRWDQALRPYTNIFIGFCWWECGTSGFNADYTNHLKQLLPYIAAGDLPRWTPKDPPTNGGNDMATRKQAVDIQNLEGVTKVNVIFRRWDPETEKQVVLDTVELFAPADVTNVRVRATIEEPEEPSNPNPPISEKFAIGDRVKVTANALNVRSEPGGPIVGTAVNGDVGTVDDGPVLANDFPRWLVSFDKGLTGWCAEDWLEVYTPSSNPLTGLTLSKPFAVPYVLTSPFNAPRSYANGKHEGSDYDVLTAVANSQEPILCLYPGTVDISTDSNGGYGKYVRVKHERNGSPFYTRYAHMDERFVTVGQVVKAGDPLGEIGTTGNVTGEHVHINLEVPGYGLGGYVVPDVVDPHPYIGSSSPTLPGQKVDILPYFQPSGQFGRYVVFHFSDGRTQAQQMEKLANGRTILWKGEGQWIDGKQVFDYEEMLVDAQGVKKFKDTSSGGKSAYDLAGVIWLPRIVEIGKVYQSSPTVREFDRVTCQTTASNATTDYIYVKALLPTWTSPIDPSITFNDVLVCEWRKTPDINTPAIEVYELAPDVCYARWNDGAIGELPQGRQPLSFQLTNCT